MLLAAYSLVYYYLVRVWIIIRSSRTRLNGDVVGVMEASGESPSTLEFDFSISK